MLIKEVRIQNFRNLVDVKVPLEETATYLVGENNTGKSSILLAIDTACGGRRATVDDLSKKEDGTRAEKSVIDIIFRSKNPVFNEAVTTLLSANIERELSPHEMSGIRTVLKSSKEGSFLTATRTYLQWQEEWIESNNRPPDTKILDLFATYYIRASRDLSEEITRKTSDWGRVLSNLDISIEDRNIIEEQLEDIAQSISRSSPVMKNLAENLEKIAKTHTGIESISLDSLPTSIEEIARSIDVVITNNNLKLPLRYQGLGSRSLASLMVYRSLFDLRIGSDLGIRPHIITLLEEPEAHLHPQAQASARRLIAEIPGQTVISTHSNILINEVYPSSIRITRSDANGTRLQFIDIEKARDIAVFRRFVERPLGEIFFARLVIFVDGTAERISLPILLESVLKWDPSGRGITFVDTEGMEHDQFDKATKALDTLGDIPWLVFVDNDQPGWNAIKNNKGRDDDILNENHSQVISSGTKQLEQMFLDAGFYQEIQYVANTYNPRDARDPQYGKYGELRLGDYNDKDGKKEYLDFLKHNKGWAGEHISKEAVKNGRAMPEPVIELAKAVERELETI